MQPNHSLPQTPPRNSPGAIGSPGLDLTDPAQLAQECLNVAVGLRQLALAFSGITPMAPPSNAGWHINYAAGILQAAASGISPDAVIVLPQQQQQSDVTRYVEPPLPQARKPKTAAELPENLRHLAGHLPGTVADPPAPLPAAPEKPPASATVVERKSKN